MPQSTNQPRYFRAEVLTEGDVEENKKVSQIFEFISSGFSEIEQLTQKS
jgi:hypothetical protein